MDSPFQFLLPQKCLGVDIGTSFVKVVEISKQGSRRKLENYGSLTASVLYDKPFRTFEKNTLLLLDEDVARAILAVIEEAKIKTKRVVFSIPDFSSFFTSFELPQMTESELPQAVRFEARQHVPMPLSEVTLDWQIVEGHFLDKETVKTKLKILLVAVPNEVINQYREIARLAQLELVSLEAEVFGLLRSLVDETEKRPIALVDIGAQSTTCSIVEKRLLKVSHSFDASGNELTRIIAKSLDISDPEAEIMKKQYGLLAPEGNETARQIRDILLPFVDMILKEVEMIMNNFSREREREIQKIILAGGSALLPGLKEYFSQNIKKEVEIANPFAKIFYPPILENILRQMSPSYAIATGLALRGLEK